MFSSDSEDRRRIMFIVLVRATFVAPGVFVPEKQQKSLRSVVGCWPGNDWHAQADQCPIQTQMSLEMVLTFFIKDLRMLVSWVSLYEDGFFFKQQDQQFSWLQFRWTYSPNDCIFFKVLISFLSLSLTWKNILGPSFKYVSGFTKFSFSFIPSRYVVPCYLLVKLLGGFSTSDITKDLWGMFIKIFCHVRLRWNCGCLQGVKTSQTWENSANKISVHL